VYSWDARLSESEAFRIYLKAVFGPGDETEWLYAGFWGPVTDPVIGREKPTFDRGLVDMDWLKMKAKAVSYQFKVVSAGTKPLAGPPALHDRDGQPPLDALAEKLTEAFAQAGLRGFGISCVAS
jgi:hypothetical protein